MGTPTLAILCKWAKSALPTTRVSAIKPDCPHQPGLADHPRGVFSNRLSHNSELQCKRSAWAWVLGSVQLPSHQSEVLQLKQEPTRTHSGPRVSTAPLPAPRTHVQAGVVGEQPVVTESHVLLLPLLVQGLAAPLQQDALRTEAGSGEGASPQGHRAREGGSSFPSPCLGPPRARRPQIGLGLLPCGGPRLGQKIP